MKSPFPGMDPYLQQHWRDVHASLVIYARDQLQSSLPRDLVARAEERVYLEREGELDRSFYPDIRVLEQRPSKSATAAVGGVELAEPFIITFRDEPITETFLQILDAQTGKRVVTFIEFISPTNKVPGEGYDAYRNKQKEAEKAGVSLVEIDLILGGKRALSRSRSGNPIPMCGWIYRRSLSNVTSMAGMNTSTISKIPTRRSNDAEWADDLLRAAGKRK